MLAVLPLTLTKRTRIGPVIGDPSRRVAMGSWIVWLAVVGVTSPCQPLTSETWPAGSMPASAVLLPRLTTR
jgi:hypothetical protein